MAKISVISTSYVDLVTGACFADMATKSPVWTLTRTGSSNLRIESCRSMNRV